jgi:hypothetical protein
MVSEQPAQTNSCPWCEEGYPFLETSYKGQPKKHLYPKDYKGQRAGMGPYCQAF